MQIRLLIILFLLVSINRNTFGQNVSIKPPSEVINSADFLKIELIGDSLIPDEFELELSVNFNGIPKGTALSNTFTIEEFTPEYLFQGYQDPKGKNGVIAIIRNPKINNGVYIVHYRLLAVTTKKEITQATARFVLPAIKKPNLLDSSYLNKSQINKLGNPLDSFQKVKKPKLTKAVLKDFKSTGSVSRLYTYGLQQYNPNATSPQGYAIYNGNASLTYKIVPVNMSFQYTDFKEYYGIPKYFRVSLDTRQLKQNIANEVAAKQKKVQDSLNSYKRTQQITEQKIAYLKSKLDTSKGILNERLLAEAKANKEELINQEKAESEKYLKLIKDSAENAVKANDTLSKSLLNDSRSKMDSIQKMQEQIKLAELKYEKAKHIYDSTSQELKLYQDKLNSIRSKTDTLQKLNSIYQNPDSVLYSYISSKLPHPENKAGKAIWGGVSSFLIGIKTLEVGMCNPNYSAFLINGTPLKGLNIEWANQKFYAGFTYGKTIVNPIANLQRNQYNPLLAVRNVYNYFDFNNDTLTRKVLACKIGVGKSEGNNLHIGFLNGVGNDKISNDTSIHHKIERNGVNEIGAQLKLGKSSFLNFAYAKSSLLKLGSLSESSLSETMKQIYAQQYNDAAELVLNSKIQKTGTSLLAKVQLVSTNYESFGLNFLNSDNLRYEFQLKQTISRGIRITLSYRFYQDNLLWIYNQRNLILTAGLTLQYKINKNLSLSLLCSPATINKKLEHKSVESSNLFKDNSLISSLLIKYKNKKHQFDLTDNFYNLNSDTQASIYNQASLLYTLSIGKATLFQAEAMHFYSTNTDTSINSSLILQTGFKTTIRKVSMNIKLKGSYKNNRDLDYGYDIKMQYPIFKNLIAEGSFNKYVGGNFLLGYNDELLRKYPYQGNFKITFLW